MFKSRVLCVTTIEFDSWIALKLGEKISRLIEVILTINVSGRDLHQGAICTRARFAPAKSTSPINRAHTPRCPLARAKREQRPTKGLKRLSINYLNENSNRCVKRQGITMFATLLCFEDGRAENPLPNQVKTNRTSQFLKKTRL